MSALLVLGLLLAAQDATAPDPAPEPPPVSMDVAKARVATVKAVWAAIASGDEAALKRLATPTATFDVNGLTGSLKLSAIAPLKDCTRTKPYQVNATDVQLTMTCTGTLPPETTAIVVFDGDKVSQVTASHTIYVPPPAETESR